MCSKEKGRRRGGAVGEKFTGAGDWLLSFPEARHAIAYSGVDIPGELIVRAAARACGDASIIRAALNDIEARGLIHRVRYTLHGPDPLVSPVFVGGGQSAHNVPDWEWRYRKGRRRQSAGVYRDGESKHLSAHTKRLDDANAKHDRSGSARIWRKRERRYAEWVAALSTWRQEQG